MANLVMSQVDHESEASDRSMFGFWIYLMTDLLMFAVLFAVFVVLSGKILGGGSGRELFSLPLALTETYLLLTSSFTCGLAMIAARKHLKSQTLIWFGITFAIGLVFLSLELMEFKDLIHEGYSLRTNAFWSSFYVLVGTHGLHILTGLIWIATALVYIMKRGLSSNMIRKLAMLSLFWHFLDIVWIFIFTIVYLGAFV